MSDRPEMNDIRRFMLQAVDLSNARARLSGEFDVLEIYVPPSLYAAIQEEFFTNEGKYSSMLQNMKSVPFYGVEFRPERRTR
jgi:hypothetical protein